MLITNSSGMNESTKLSQIKIKRNIYEYILLFYRLALTNAEIKVQIHHDNRVSLRGLDRVSSLGILRDFPLFFYVSELSYADAPRSRKRNFH